VTIKELNTILDEEFPRTLSAHWDNDGIMVCPNVNMQIKRVMLSLDATTNAIMMASKQGCDLLLTHHPLIFHSIGGMDGQCVTTRRVMLALAKSVSVISLHTRLDACTNGVVETLCEVYGIKEPFPLGIFDESGLFARAGRLPDGRKCVVCPGSGNSAAENILYHAMWTDIDVFITGELSYNNYIDLQEMVPDIRILGHYESEVVILPKLAKLLEKHNIAYEYFDKTIQR